MKVIVKTLLGLEGVLEAEIQELGYPKTTKITRAVLVEDASLKMIYHLNYQLRTGLRVLMVLKETTINSVKELYDAMYYIKWFDYFDLTNDFAIDSTSTSEFFNNSLYNAQVAKDAIVDQFNYKYRRRPDVNVKSPDIKINLHIRDNILTIALDSSGEPLFKRGYRKQTGTAPLNEVLAAGMIRLSEWDKNTNFHDPMCGSGTLSIEAFMLANQIPAQMKRRTFCFMKWLNFEPKEWMTIRKEGMDNITESDVKISGSDYDSKMIRISKENFDVLNVRGRLNFYEADFFDKTDLRKHSFIIVNPPYDKRLEEDDIEDFYKKIGDHMKHHLKGAQVWIISGSLEGMTNIGLKASKKYQLLNGSIESRFNLYELY